MKRFADKDVTTAVGYMKELAGQMKAATLIPQEQIDRIAEINRDPDPISRADKTLAMSQQLVKEAEAHLARHEQNLRELGIDPSRTREALDGSRFNTASRKAFAEANDESSHALEEEIDAEVSRVMALAAPTGPGLPEIEHAWA